MTQPDDCFAPLMRAVLGAPGAAPVADLRAFLAATACGETDKREVCALLSVLSAQPLLPEMAEALVREIEAGAPTGPALSSRGLEAVNIVGTGGGIPSFNISSTASIIAAAAGVRVLKSGSTAYTSAAGAVEFLRAAGIAPVRSHAGARDALDRFGIAFYMPGDFSPLLKRLAMAAMPRPLKTFAPVLNRIGPFLRMLPVGGQLTGLSAVEDLDWYSEVFRRLGRDNVTLLANPAGLDEGCSFSPNRLLRILDGGTLERVIDPASLGFATGGPDDIAGGDAEANLRLTEAIYAGEAPQVATDCALFNAALLIVTGTSGDDLAAAMAAARAAVESGAARALFNRLRSAQQRLERAG